MLQSIACDRVSPAAPEMAGSSSSGGRCLYHGPGGAAASGSPWSPQGPHEPVKVCSARTTRQEQTTSDLLMASLNW